uniref:Neutral ceramidase n=1 Tax=Ciona savignyi TaxID=51511 RepID=H2YR12_CIOSA
YYIGVARCDVTGPVVQVNMMGYAHPEQVANGLHTRLYSRAFVVADNQKQNRVAFVSFDGGMASQLLKLEVVKRLKEKHGDIFTERNVVISGTHTHSGPAGFFQFLLFEMTSLGHVEQSTTAFVDGIVESIELANSKLELGRIKIGSGLVDNGNINRSPTSYLLNPEAERARYTHDTEQSITVLSFDNLAGDPLGMLSWYPAHPTNMNFTNLLINSDNKGRASTLFEKMMRKPGETLAGKVWHHCSMFELNILLMGDVQNSFLSGAHDITEFNSMHVEEFVAAFAQANLGDVSPRTNGPVCVDTGLDCEPLSSTCNGTSQNCVGFGPGKDMFDSTDIIARRQLDAAKLVYKSATERLDGPVDWIHQYVDMTQQSVQLDDGSTVTTCKPGMGYSFAAGCTDGAGAFNFVQGMTRGTPFWNTIRDILAKIICTVEPPREYYNCHQPKPVLLPTGYMDKPYDWHPTIVDIQVLRIGQLLIAAVPGEYTTMAGRRLKERLYNEAVSQGMAGDTKVVLAGLSNVYTHYITTPEEYNAQRYEAASTIFGPHTFQVYQQKYTDLIAPLVAGNKDDVDLGPTPDLKPANQSRIAPVPHPDKLPPGINFGDVISDVNMTYTPGDTVKVTFHGANPRHNMKLGSTYLEIQRDEHGSWTTIYTDADWSTKFTWLETNSSAPPADITIYVIIEWNIPTDETAGSYRVLYHG